MSSSAPEILMPGIRGSVPQRPRRPRKGGAWGKAGLAAIHSDATESTSDSQVETPRSTNQHLNPEQGCRENTESVLLCEEGMECRGEAQELTSPSPKGAQSSSPKARASRSLRSQSLRRIQQQPPSAPLSPSQHASSDQHLLHPTSKLSPYFPGNLSYLPFLPPISPLNSICTPSPSSPSQSPPAPLVLAPHPSTPVPTEPGQVLLPQNLGFWSPTTPEGIKTLNPIIPEGAPPAVVPLPPASLLGKAGTAQPSPCFMLDGRVLVPPGSPAAAAAAAAAMAGRAAFSLVFPYPQNRRAAGKGKGPGTGRRACGCPARMCKCGACPPKPANARRQKGKGPGTGRRACGCPSRRCSCGAAALANLPQVPMLVPVVVDLPQGGQQTGMVPQSGPMLPMHHQFLHQLHPGQHCQQPFAFPVPVSGDLAQVSAHAFSLQPNAVMSHGPQGLTMLEGSQCVDPKEPGREGAEEQPCTDLRLGNALSPAPTPASSCQEGKRSRRWLSPSSMRCGSPTPLCSSQLSGEGEASGSEEERQDVVEEANGDERDSPPWEGSEADSPKLHMPCPSRPRCRQDLAQVWALDGREDESISRRWKEGECAKGKRSLFGGPDSSSPLQLSPAPLTRGQIPPQNICKASSSSKDGEDVSMGEQRDHTPAEEAELLRSEVRWEVRCFARLQGSFMAERLAGSGAAEEGSGMKADGAELSSSASAALESMRRHGKRAKCLLLKLHRLCSLPSGCTHLKGDSLQVFNSCTVEAKDARSLVPCAGVCGRLFHPACLSWKEGMSPCASNTSNTSNTSSVSSAEPQDEDAPNVTPLDAPSSSKRGLFCQACRAWGDVFRAMLDHLPSRGSKGAGIRSSSSCSNMAPLAAAANLDWSVSASLGWSWEDILPRDATREWREWARSRSPFGQCKGLASPLGACEASREDQPSTQDMGEEGEGRSVGCSCTAHTVCQICAEDYSIACTSAREAVTALFEALESRPTAASAVDNVLQVEAGACASASIPPTPPLHSRLASCTTSLDGSLGGEAGDWGKAGSAVSTPQKLGPASQSDGPRAFSPWVRKSGLAHSLISPASSSVFDPHGPITPEVKALARNPSSPRNGSCLKPVEGSTSEMACLSPKALSSVPESPRATTSYPPGSTVVYLTLGDPDSLTKSANGGPRPYAVMPVQLADGGVMSSSGAGKGVKRSNGSDSKPACSVGYLCYYYVPDGHGAAQELPGGVPAEGVQSPRKRRRKQAQPKCSAALEVAC